MLKISDLHQYQKNIANHILTHKASFVIAEMGLGKTISTLSALSRIPGRVLILAPLRVAHTSWPDEISSWEHTKDMSYEIIHGKKEAYKFDSTAKLHITNFEALSFLFEYVKKRKTLPWSTLVIDESSKVKSHKTNRFKTLKKLRKGFAKIVLLTGTPCPNSMMELWSQLFILDGGERLDTSFGRFKMKYFYPIDYMKYKWEPVPQTAQILKEKIKDITISLKAKDYIELPDVTYNYVKVSLPDETMATYKELEKEFFIELENTTVQAVNAAVLSSKLRQVLQGGLYDDDKKFVELNNEKVNALADIVESSPSPVLCAYQFRFEIGLINDNIKNATFLTGDMNKDKKIIAEWNKGEIKLLCVHPASAGHGLNLQHGGHVAVWLGITWSLEQYQQFNARIYRQGQKNKVIIHHIVIDNTVDIKVAKAIKIKGATQDTIISSLKTSK